MPYHFSHRKYILRSADVVDLCGWLQLSPLTHLSTQNWGKSLQKGWFTKGALAAIGTLVLVGASVVPANASSASITEGTAALIERVAPNQGEVAALVETESGWSTTDQTASIPRDSFQPITLPTGSGNALEVSLPGDLQVGPGTAAVDGTIVYASASGDADLAVQALEGGATRVQSVIRSATSTHEFAYTVGGGFVPAEAADGTFWAVGFDAQGDFQAYSIGAAWAQDANGQAVDTHYEIRGNDLVQVVSPSASTAYPVVADPTWQWYSAAYGAGFSKAETRNLASFGAVTGFCAALPGPFGVACAVFGAQWFLQAQLAVNARSCVFISVVPAPIALRWNSPECR